MKKKFSKSVKDISAINYTKTTNDTSKSNGKHSINYNPSNTHSTKYIKDVVYPKNINEYKHLLTNYMFTQGDLDWTLDLRNEKKIDKITKDITLSPPSFYDKDLENFKKKKKIILNEPFLHFENPFQLNHLVHDNCNTINSSQINFESTLRRNKPVKGAKIIKHSETWKNLAYSPISNLSYFLPPVTSKSKEHIQKINKYIVREYEHVNEKTKYENDNIIRKTVRPNKKFALGWLGEHLEREKYNQKYKTKNVNSIRHILKYHGNALSNFEIGLRTFGNKEFNPLTHPKIIIKKYNPIKEERDKGIVNKKIKIKDNDKEKGKN